MYVHGYVDFKMPQTLTLLPGLPFEMSQALFGLLMKTNGQHPLPPKNHNSRNSKLGMAVKTFRQ